MSNPPAFRIETARLEDKAGWKATIEGGGKTIGVTNAGEEEAVVDALMHHIPAHSSVTLSTRSSAMVGRITHISWRIQKGLSLDELECKPDWAALVAAVNLHKSVKARRVSPFKGAAEGPNLHIVTDGSCIQGQGSKEGPGGWAAQIYNEPDDTVTTMHGVAANTTSVKMEIQAVVEALKHLPPHSHAEIVTDSKHIRNFINAETRRPAENGDGLQPEANSWVSLAHALNGHTIYARWNKGHADRTYLAQEDVDELSREDARKVQDGRVKDGERWCETVAFEAVRTR